MENINKIQYRGQEITVKQTAPTRFGRLYFATNDYGEPVMNQLYFRTEAEAVADEKKNLDLCLEN